jgi:hypothetical protein
VNVVGTVGGVVQGVGWLVKPNTISKDSDNIVSTSTIISQTASVSAPSQDQDGFTIPSPRESSIETNPN